MAQQTAVEWLVNNIHSENYQKAFGQTYISIELLEQAKQMEKQQIMDAYWNGTIDIDKKDALIEAEIFYKETYAN